jgi:1-acyl-sn-glycerol-3-phosphate acyltransferase
MTMLRKLRYGLTGSLIMLAVSLNTALATVAIFILAVIKFLSPKGRARNAVTHWLSSVGEYWISFNSLMIRFIGSVKWDIQIDEGIFHDGRYLVFCNHQSWVDILVLQHALNRRAPFMRFLLKQELIWVPLLGFCWWALDMAFLRRYSKQQMLKNPTLRNKDLEIAAHACEKLKHIPVSMMSFPEGTRFTLAKQAQQNSPYRHLLRTRYGGTGQILYSFDKALDHLIDVTICYPDGVPGLWQYVSGQVKNIVVKVRRREIPDNIRGKNFREDAEAKAALRVWMRDIWTEKDAVIDVILGHDANLTHSEQAKGADSSFANL